MKARKLIVLLIILGFTAMGFKVTGHIGITVNSGERVYVHTDRDLYIAGENLFFKLYVLSDRTYQLSAISRIAYIILRDSADRPVVELRMKVDRGIAYGNIYLPDTLGTGIYQMVAFTNWMRNSGEATFFKKEICIAKRFDTDLQALHTFSGSIDSAGTSTPDHPLAHPLRIITDKTEYSRRGKIRLTLHFPGHDTSKIANVSVSVYENVPGSGDPFTLGDYLASEPVSSPKGNMRFKNIRYLPEQKGEIIQGKVIDRHTLKAIPGVYVYLSVQDTMVNLQYEISGKDGLFRFLLTGYYNDKTLYFSVKNYPANQVPELELENKFQLKNSFIPGKQSINPLLKDFILRSEAIVNVQKAYNTMPKAIVRHSIKKHFMGPRVYGRASRVVDLSDFVPLTDLQEIAWEILPTFRIRKHDNLFYASLGDNNLHEFMDQEPAIFLDGVYIENINQIIKFGSDKISRIELVNARYIYGELMFPGILAVFSNDSAIQTIQPFPVSRKVDIVGYQPYSFFSAPKFAAEPMEYHPDFQQLLYWNPNIEIREGTYHVSSFFASDNACEYVIEVEGISSDGHPVRGLAKIRVE